MRQRTTQLTDEEVAAIRADTRKNVEIAREYRVSESHVSLIRRGLSCTKTKAERSRARVKKAKIDFSLSEGQD